MNLAIFLYVWVESGLLMLLLLRLFSKTFKTTPWSVVYVLVGGPILLAFLIYCILKGE